MKIQKRGVRKFEKYELGLDRVSQEKKIYETICK